MRISSTRTLNRALACAAIVVASASYAQASLSITNGNFETFGTAAPDPTAANQTGVGVFGWADDHNATSPWYFNVTQSDQVSPSGSVSVVMTGNHDATAGVPVPWIYQSIGFNTDAKTTLKLQFDLGGFTDNNPIDAHIDVQLFKATGFTAVDGTDIVGAAGVTQVGSTFSTERLGFNGNSGVVQVPVDFDLTGVTASDELFLRFDSTVPVIAGTPSTNSNYVRLDNIKIRPDVVIPPANLTWVSGNWDQQTTPSFKDSTNTPMTFKDTDNVTFDDSGAVDGTGVSTVTMVGALSPNSVTINSAHDYIFTGTGSSITGTNASGTFAGATLTKLGTGKVTFMRNGTYPGGIDIEAGTVEVSGTGRNGIQGGPIVNNGTLILNRLYADPNAQNSFNGLTITNPISGSGNIIIKNDAFLGLAGNQTAAYASTFTGTIDIQYGFVFIGNRAALGSTVGGTTVEAGATLASVDNFHLGTNATISEPLTLNGFGIPDTFFNAGNPSGALYQYENTRTFAGPITLATTSSIVVRQPDGATTPTVMNWTGTLTAAPGAGLQKEGNGAFNYGGAVMESLTIYGGKVTQTGGTTKVNTLYMEVGTTMDLTKGTLVVKGDGSTAEFDTLRAMALSGQLLTSLDPTKYVLGMVDNARQAPKLTSVNGVAVDPNSVVVRGTLIGDFDLNGKVEFADLLTLAKNYNGSGKLYQQGDGDYSGTVDFTDLLGLAKNYNQVVPADDAGQLGAAFMADFALAESLAPEPATLSLLVAAGGLVGMRRRRSH